MEPRKGHFKIDVPDSPHGGKSENSLGETTEGTIDNTLFSFHIKFSVILQK